MTDRVQLSRGDRAGRACQMILVENCSWPACSCPERYSHASSNSVCIACGTVNCETHTHPFTQLPEDATRNRVADASYWAGYERGREHAEQNALMMLAWIVESVGGELKVTPRMTRRRVERIDSATTDEFTLRVTDA